MEIDDSLFAKINGISYTPNTYIDISELRYLRMLCYGLDGNTYVGEMIVNEKIADTVLEIFQKLYENQYPIERMVLVDNYQANDELSMSDNNTSAFNFRQIAGSDKLSNHSYGMAIDINPKYNPYVKTAADGSILCQPESGRDYIDRTKDFPYKIDENDLAYLLFTEAGFTWGGNWNSVKDYQHFEMEFEN
ncbi:MAG: M15 family metallopeptidase [Lachnospiraceae bacterium]|nr:M15 family metallopeptidase [Lachnospiraceae bacterium]